ncbi:23S rRNA (pseudouridine(1915)-N(3))-methyltransferase RlmH [Methylovirgula ligni]|uniref:Ribosomal RNA large subunit methyltransferase H n=1 Tax=Methylovirgula ligni TaxID=569860 RepID=A0A3D9YXB9_9HYPH|nr:23S rRNA (pseudouridine(1915)-N(3))-methyltransferase RlmH [Methylovirgula ligni]QAY94769.1 23S rRNA (pseudouridine(1915)-N(3))-methyltransferase RlmH [Methylovirgula ligni]REF87332.1 23S rRNA (pseudouridine1915-N3)-methyltransferase [Methylovirgula ligni]
MRLLLISVGRAKPGPERDLVARYLLRAAAIGRSIGIQPIELREIDESRARRTQDRKLEEAKTIRAALGTDAHVIACDETGKAITSTDFATQLGTARDNGAATLGLVLGGPDGLDPAFRAEARLVLAFGAMTWPHQLARALAAEQIYRATTILSGHPYHRN